jgi:hypothetical protein
MLNQFLELHYPYISEKIEWQQNQYGLARIHSHRHISRCIIYSDWYADLMNIGKEDIQRMQLYLAIGFHDIGREGELEDVWESKSKDIYMGYLKDMNIDNYAVNSKLLQEIIHDVDCLDIMRSGAGRGGIFGFDRNYLYLLKEQPTLQEKMIGNAWNLINLTDSLYFENKDCLKMICDLKFNEWK